MTPQRSSSSGRAFRYGMTAQAYMRIKCHYIYIYALYSSLYNVILRSAIPTLSVASRLAWYCFHCFERWVSKYTHYPLKFRYLLGGNKNLIRAPLQTLHSPGGPPRHKFTNYLKTKNRPFFNPFSWTVPVTWRSPERN
jgi:hypothetical protein